MSADRSRMRGGGRGGAGGAGAGAGVGAGRSGAGGSEARGAGAAPPRARMFVALELPAAVRAALTAWRAPLLAAAPDALRPVADDALHVTLCFLGHRPLTEIAPIAAAVAAVADDAAGGAAAGRDDAAGAGAGGAAGWAGAGGAAAGRRPDLGGLALGAPLWLPRRRPHALALALRDERGALTALQAALAAALAAGGWFAPEQRPYLPHVTLARVRRGGDPRTLARRPLPDPPALAFAGAAVTLFRSRLGRGGARYEALARHPGQ